MKQRWLWPLLVLLILQFKHGSCKAAKEASLQQQRYWAPLSRRLHIRTCACITPVTSQKPPKLWGRFHWQPHVTDEWTETWRKPMFCKHFDSISDPPMGNCQWGSSENLLKCFHVHGSEEHFTNLIKPLFLWRAKQNVSINSWFLVTFTKLEIWQVLMTYYYYLIISRCLQQPSHIYKKLTEEQYRGSSKN